MSGSVDGWLTPRECKGEAMPAALCVCGRIMANGLDKTS
jgi:hypothetical protein